MSNTICIDAGPVVQLTAFPEAVEIQAIWERWDEQAATIIAPALLFYEVTNVLFRYMKHNIFTREMAYAALDASLALPIILIEDIELHQLAAVAAERFGLKAAYDAHYLALAERSGAELWTTDEKLYKKMQALGVEWVRLI
jgi:predicted nucleic acid-binding protein